MALRQFEAFDRLPLVTVKDDVWKTRFLSLEEDFQIFEAWFLLVGAECYTVEVGLEEVERLLTVHH